MIGAKLIRLAAVATATVSGLSGVAYGLLNQQSRHARRVIGIAPGDPLHADGIHSPSAGSTSYEEPLELAVLGDSSAAGLGVDVSEQLLGVLIAKGLAEELERPVSLRTHAIVGSTTQGLAAQVEAVLRTSPRLALILIGANDVTSRLPVRVSVTLLEAAVRELTEAGVAVVVGTCPDLGTIRPIPQPLRSLARSWSLALAKAQRRVVEKAGGHAVPVADLLSPEFLTRPTELFSKDRFHPSAAGYQAAAELLVPNLCYAIGEWEGAPLPSAPTRSATVEARRPTRRVVARMNRRWGRRADA